MAATLYCAEQISIPAELPDILKQLTKAAILSQPKDLVAWAADYFQQLNEGKNAPVGNALPLVSSESKPVITIEQLKSLGGSLASGAQTVSVEALLAASSAAGIPSESAQETLKLGEFGEQVNWANFVALSCAHLQPGLSATAHAAIEALGTGGSVGVDTFAGFYKFLADLDVDTRPESTAAILSAVAAHGASHDGQITAADFDALSTASA